ncbi:MAG: hypothetical protein LAO51_17875 [Acidobacteriia bacterium]|nr:hypothetical protein [Terriglobia bacterium]
MTAQATVSYTVDFGRPPRTEPAPERPGGVLRVARLLALAHQIDAKIRAGEYDDLTDAARKMGITRTRITQIVNLTMLAPEIQAAILAWPATTEGRDPVSERSLRAIVAEVVWSQQRERWKTLRPTFRGAPPGRDSR